jgi:hypothetical protein
MEDLEIALENRPGALAGMGEARQMADAGVNIEVQYSDHDNRLVLVVDDIQKARAISRAWR